MEQTPLILTLSLDPAAQAYFNALRTLHFPPERNYLHAHLTLFHHLTIPEKEIMETVREVCLSQKPFLLEVTGLLPLGRGVAFKLESETLLTFHAQLRQRWLPALTAQDQQKLRPHVTVQNKVTPEAAKALLHKLNGEFKPFTTKATGVMLFKYLNGPWQFLQQFDFNQAESLAS
ncbi:2'-5' RNA ligase family protein [Nibribacter ruber]|uniref:2'-5' RNA ligase family protein n=1 Tax=Nibribacter ruber TaxID=2698458 RepID=A0A6P1NW49_9BACT|nr:2'-5' RNA ligase family protein [Nibribacter ruber]QHL86015.1 2'-5' RNA ligase family protein [Nibribacter ruber]